VHRSLRASLILAFSALPCLAQTPAAPAFEVASVKAAPPPAAGPVFPSARGGPGTTDPTQITYTNVLMRTLLLNAYGVKPYQLAGPEWIQSERYHVAAKLPPGSSKEALAQMLQNLLRERFHAEVHRENRELPAYVLTLANGGPKLNHSAAQPPDAATAPLPVTDLPKASAPAPIASVASGTGDLPPMAPAMEKRDPIVLYLNGKARLEGHGTMQQLADLLSSVLGRPVLDRTSDSGDYVFDIHWAADLTNSAAVEPSSEPDIFRALQAQGGMKLESRKERIGMLVVDRLARVPAEN